MRTLRARLTPHSAFGTPLQGDSLFGQVCWAIRNRAGEERLLELLNGYTEGRPYLVLSDALPAGYLPRPVLPGSYFESLEGRDRKDVKQLRWIPLERVREPISAWLRDGVANMDLPGGWFEAAVQPHNRVDRRAETTRGRDFAPYGVEQLWPGRMVTTSRGAQFEVGQMELYCVVDDERLSIAELHQALVDIGLWGFGRGASRGLGRFTVDALEEHPLPAQEEPNAYLTLAPTAPQGFDWDPDRCFYHLCTRFGRHGDRAVLFGSPFKTPLLLAAAGAVLSPTTFERRPVIGRGLGGDGSLSKAVPQTVHQGYAPVVWIRLEDPPIQAKKEP
jgi:CRISPR-associated protein Csm4